MLGQYVQNLLATQDLSNSFSIDYPTKPLIKLQDDDPKLIAYYLPQYYPDPHNEKWWGRGSTEWTNITKFYPQYVGQYQPRLPGELGFYDLRIKDNIYRQIELAHFYGIYGFSFYYYWFDGERLLDLPFNVFINHKTIHFPFNICWVNETWTKQWEGSSNVPLMVQNKSSDSYKKFILFVRSHPHVAKDIFEGAENQKDVIDVSEYVDMQELLCAADVLITDYSSSMWDYSLTGRPCFIYANDLAQYKKERNFHTPITDWPFPMAERNTELQRLILRFDEKNTLGIWRDITGNWTHMSQGLLQRRYAA